MVIFDIKEEQEENISQMHTIDESTTKTTGLDKLRELLLNS